MSIDLGKLEKVENLREIWNHEAYDFTTWLAEDQNIQKLIRVEKIGMKHLNG